MAAIGKTMVAMQFQGPGRPLVSSVRPIPRPAAHEVLVKIAACGVCRTDLHLVDGELTRPREGVIPGHEIVGMIADAGAEAGSWSRGERVGIPWLGWTCGECHYCMMGRENLCERARFTGYTLDGGYAQYAVADARYCFRLPDGYSDTDAAPLLCAGLIGHRALVAAGDAACLGIYGFGAAAHIITQVAVHQGRRVFAFTRAADEPARQFARTLGACWAGASDQPSPELLDAAILFAPVGALVPLALQSVRKGGIVVCAGIHMSDIPAFPYSLLWGERRIASVANLTRADAEAFLALAPRIPVRTTTIPFALDAANEALEAVRTGRISGAAVLTMA